MGQYASIFIVPDAKAVSKVTHPSKPNWITAHAIASELSIAEVERLWVRFQQLGCNKDGELTDEIMKKSEYNPDVFMRNILRKFLSATTKKITFENFLRALKWCEQAELEQKVKAIFVLLNNGNPVTRDLFGKILERVYPEDKGEPVQRIVGLLFQMYDTTSSGDINEEEFLRGTMKIPRGILNQVLDFQILPEEMKERLHKNLLEFRSESAAGVLVGQTPGPTPAMLTPGRAKRIPTDGALREIADKIHKKDWQRVANKLGFFADDVDEIRESYPNSTVQQVYQMLKQWRERDGVEAYSEVLERALHESGMVEAAIVLTSY